jgi:hypothetical protein
MNTFGSLRSLMEWAMMAQAAASSGSLSTGGEFAAFARATTTREFTEEECEIYLRGPCPAV